MKTDMRRPIAMAAVLCAAAAPGLSATQVIDGVTCGRASCPRPLQLVDGETVTVTLSGERLGGLVSGVVTDETGRPVEGVTVELASSRLATRRGATVTARGAPALSGLQLRFQTRLRRTITAPVELSTAAAMMTAPASVERDPTMQIQDPTRTLTTVEGSLLSISSATPTTIDLGAGKPGKVVTLTGTNLDRATEVRLEQPVVGAGITSGVSTEVETQPLRWNVKAELLPSSGPSRRDVRLTADLPYSGGGSDLPVRIVLSGPRNSEATAFVQLSVLLLKPNLSIRFVTVSPRVVNLVDSRTIVLQITNNGTAAAVIPLQSNLARLDDPTADAPHFVRTGSGVTLGPGESRETTLTLPPPEINDPVVRDYFQTRRSVVYSATVDPDGLVDEGDETDNRVERVVPFSPAQPADLVLERIMTVPNAALKDGYEFEVTISNRGGVGTSVEVSTSTCVLNGQPLKPPPLSDSFGSVSVKMVEPEERSVVRMRPGGRLADPGTYVCLFRVSPEGTDGNPDDNQIRYTWTVDSGGT